MSVTKLFWLTTIITVALVGIQLLGYPTLELIAVFLLIDLVVLKYSGDNVMKNFGRRAEEYSGKFSVIQSSVGSIEKSVGELSTFMGEVKTAQSREQTTLGVIQSALDRHKEDLRFEFKDSMDRMAGKFIEMENDFHDFKRGFASAIGAMDDRLKMVESPNGNLRAPETIAEQIQEEYAEIAPENQN